MEGLALFKCFKTPAGGSRTTLSRPPFVFHWVPRYLLYITGNLFRDSIGFLFLRLGSETKGQPGFAPHGTGRGYINPQDRHSTELEREIIDVITKLFRITVGIRVHYKVEYNLDVVREGSKKQTSVRRGEKIGENVRRRNIG